jgi:hypothetical protein
MCEAAADTNEAAIRIAQSASSESGRALKSGSEVVLHDPSTKYPAQQTQIANRKFKLLDMASDNGCLRTKPSKANPDIGAAINQLAYAFKT